MSVYADVTPALHPAVIEELPGYEDHKGYVQGITEAFSVAYEGIADLHKARAAVARNPTMNEAAQLLMVAKEATKRMDAMTRKFDSATANLSKAIDAIEGDLTRPLATSAAAGPIPTEIRAYVHSLDNDKRSAFLNEAMANKDEQTLAAVLGAPSYLSGITEADKAYRVRRYHEQTKPELAQRLDLMKRAREMAHNRAGLIYMQIEKAMGAPWTRVQELREQTGAAESAFKRFAS